ncbi:hypothetical protein B0H16DRAFT_123573 [Mycena metata]|uniref:Uncharacterized protein n=1 Tax=Mycena metata TaxID=1033252 RepID=A0AAD7MX53_9AGAR|nr:hypothetical protein B0H16DRAFT_123573 [Mycena metata]
MLLAALCAFERSAAAVGRFGARAYGVKCDELVFAPRDRVCTASTSKAFAGRGLRWIGKEDIRVRLEGRALGVGRWLCGAGAGAGADVRSSGVCAIPHPLVAAGLVWVLDETGDFLFRRISAFAFGGLCLLAFSLHSFFLHSSSPSFTSPAGRVHPTDLYIV